MITFLIQITLIALITLTVSTWIYWKYFNLSWIETDTRNFLLATVCCFIPVANVVVLVVSIIIMISTLVISCIDFSMSKTLANKSVIKKITKFINNRVLHNVD